MKYLTCLRCGRKLSNPNSQKIGYGPTCAVKAQYEEDKRQYNMSAIMESSSGLDFYYVDYRKEGLINASKVINRTALKPILKIDQQVENSYGTYFPEDQSIAIKTKYRSQHDKIATYIHELIHAYRWMNGKINGWMKIDGKMFNVPEEIIAELGEYIFFLRVGAFKNPESATKFLSYQLNRIHSIYLNRINSFDRAYYTSSLLRLYQLAEDCVDYFMEGF